MGPGGEADPGGREPALPVRRACDLDLDGERVLLDLGCRPGHLATARTLLRLVGPFDAGRASGIWRRMGLTSSC